MATNGAPSAPLPLAGSLAPGVALSDLVETSVLNRLSDDAVRAVLMSTVGQSGLTHPRWVVYPATA